MRTNGVSDGGDGQEIMVAMKNLMMRSGPTMGVCSILAQVRRSYAATVLRVPAATGLAMEIAPRWVYQETLPRVLLPCWATYVSYKPAGLYCS